MNDRPIRYMVLRDQRQWDDTTSRVGLVPHTDGALLLEGLPGLPPGSAVQSAVSFDTPLSGVAVAGDGTVYRTITEDDGRLIIADPVCGDYEVVRHPTGVTQEVLKSPCGLLISGDRLLVADSGNGRILVLALPSLRQLDEWKTGLQKPVCLAADSVGRVYLVDSNKVLRFSSNGTPDATYNAAMAAHPSLTNPFALAIDVHDRLYVSDATENVLFCFDATGHELAPVALPVPGGFTPRALLGSGSRLYVSDTGSGLILVYDSITQSWIGEVGNSRGPVAALAFDKMGTLYVKPGLGETLYRLEADAARLRSGRLLVGPVDAGEGDAWERLWVDAEIPPDTAVVLEVAVSEDRTTPSNALVWHRSPALDVLLSTLVDGHIARFLWLRVTLQSHDGHSTPTLLQVQAATPAPSYLDDLPRIYRRDDAATGFLGRFLALARTELGDWERTLEETPRQLDARTVAEADLGQLAQWVALELPARLDAPEQRQLLADAQRLYRRRGTPAGLRDMVWRYLGVTIHLFESFRERHVWQLDKGLGLGLDTQLAAGAAGGLVVPGFTHADRALSGLRGDYYEGTKFEILRYSRVDKIIKFNWKYKSPLARVPSQQQFPNDYFSVRWSGQIRPRFSETYTFRTKSDDGVRLWVGGRRVLDNWTDHPATTDAGQIKLEAGRWYQIVLEFYEKRGVAVIELYWSSPSQPLEIVPEESLYSVLDPSAELAPDQHGGCELLEVGQAVVGQNRLQTVEDYGAALADDYAHRFTVVVPAAQLPRAAQRQALRDLLEAEKPAHTDFSLCLVEPRMRVGVQARVGIDSIVAGPGPAMRLGTAALGSDSFLDGDARPTSRHSPGRPEPHEVSVPIG